jgi:hypothetical protein
MFFLYIQSHTKFYIFHRGGHLNFTFSFGGILFVDASNAIAIRTGVMLIILLNYKAFNKQTRKKYKKKKFKYESMKNFYI